MADLRRRCAAALLDKRAYPSVLRMTTLRSLHSTLALHFSSLCNLVSLQLSSLTPPSTRPSLFKSSPMVYPVGCHNHHCQVSHLLPEHQRQVICSSPSSSLYDGPAHSISCAIVCHPSSPPIVFALYQPRSLGNQSFSILFSQMCETLDGDQVDQRLFHTLE